MKNLIKYLTYFLVPIWLVYTEQYDPICCFPDQYEASLMGYQGVASSHGGHGFYNATARIAYDWINNKTYFYEVTSSMTTVLPFPTGLNITAIFDYNLDEKFIIFRDGTCHSEEIGYPLFKQCIPGNATYLGDGNLQGLSLKHFRFKEDIYDSDYEITVSVVLSGKLAVLYKQGLHFLEPEDEANSTLCTPIHVIQSHMYPVNQTVLDLTGGEVFEFHAGIRDPQIFKPPGACGAKQDKKRLKLDKRPPSFFNTWNLHSMLETT